MIKVLKDHEPLKIVGNVTISVKSVINPIMQFCEGAEAVNEKTVWTTYDGSDLFRTGGTVHIRYIKDHNNVNALDEIEVDIRKR